MRSQAGGRDGERKLSAVETVEGGTWVRRRTENARRSVSTMEREEGGRRADGAPVRWRRTVVGQARPHGGERTSSWCGARHGDGGAVVLEHAGRECASLAERGHDAIHTVTSRA